MKKIIWFKTKRYGWGWYPSTWQGWLILTIYILLLIGSFLQIDTDSHSVSDTLTNFLPGVLVLTILLIAVCIMFGERPRWQWRS